MSKPFTIGIVAAILLGSGLGGYALWAAREEPKRRPRSEEGVAVETLRVRRETVRLPVLASGVVTAARDLQVFPQVEGRLVWLFKKLTPGTFVPKGQPLFRIDDRDYRLRVQQVRAEVQQAKTELALERGRRRVAELEWKQLGHKNEDGAAEAELALREPQLEAAKAALEAAKAKLETAKLQLSRTTFRAPFDAVIAESNAEIGQIASPQQRLARLVGTDRFWVRANVRASMLPHIAIPGLDGATEGARVVTTLDTGEHTVTRSGRVIRLLSGLQPDSRMAQLLCTIEDPLGRLAGNPPLHDTKDGPSPSPRYPILLDSYVDLRIEGKHERSLIELDRDALRKGDRAYVLDPERQRLEIRELQIAREHPEHVWVSSGLEDGDRVIVSALAYAVEGMRVREVKSPRKSAARIEEDASPDG